MSSAPRPFEIALFFGFGALFFIAILLVATFSGDRSSGGGIGTVVIWGTLDQTVFERHIRRLGDSNDIFRGVQYRQIDERSFDTQLLNAVAEQRQPDLILIPHTKLVQRRSTLFPLAYANTISTREFADSYIDGFEIFARPDGIYALPVAVDPLILYWNRDIYANNGLAEPPRTWETVVNTVVPQIVRRSVDRSISMSPVALGEYRNNQNSFAVISALLLQSGSRMVEEVNGQYEININVGQTQSVSSPLTSTIQFFTQFAVPSSPLYSWNRTKRTDRDEFLAGNLATYFGHGSEVDSLRRQNPNLNFDSAAFPQSADATTQRTYGTFYGLAILRSANNINGAYQVGRALTSEQSAATLATELGMAPPHRRTISVGSSGHTMQVVYNSALISRGWLSPNDATLDQVFQQAMDDVLAGRSQVSRAVTDLVSRLRQQY